MGFSFRKSVKLGKGVRLNLSRSGVGVSYGVKGLRVSQSTRGTYLNAGSGGMYYRTKLGKNGTHSKADTSSSSYHARQDEEFVIENKENALFQQYLTEERNKLKKDIILFIVFFTLFILTVPFLAFVNLIYSICVIANKYNSAEKVAVKRILDEGLKYYRDSNTDKTIEYMNLVSEIAPNKTNYCKNIIFRLYKKQGEWQTALDFITEQNIPVEKDDLKELYQKLNMHDDVIHILQNEYSKEEKDARPTLYADLAEAFISLNKPDIALEALLNGPTAKRKMTDELCAFRYALGLCYELLGKPKDAKKHFDKVYAYNSNYKEVARKIKEM